MTWTQEELAERMSRELDVDLDYRSVQRLERATQYPFSARSGCVSGRDLWDAAITILGLDRAEVNRLAGGV